MKNILIFLTIILSLTLVSSTLQVGNVGTEGINFNPVLIRPINCSSGSFYNSSYVPYSGANSNVDLGSRNFTTTGQIKFDGINQDIIIMEMPFENPLFVNSEAMISGGANGDVAIRNNLVIVDVDHEFGQYNRSIMSFVSNNNNIDNYGQIIYDMNKRRFTFNGLKSEGIDIQGNISASNLCYANGLNSSGGSCSGSSSSMNYNNLVLNNQSNTIDGNITASYFIGNGSLLTDVCLSNGTNCLTSSSMNYTNIAMTNQSNTFNQNQTINGALLINTQAQFILFKNNTKNVFYVENRTGRVAVGNIPSAGLIPSNNYLKAAFNVYGVGDTYLSTQFADNGGNTYFYIKFDQPKTNDIAFSSSRQYNSAFCLANANGGNACYRGDNIAGSQHGYFFINSFNGTNTTKYELDVNGSGMITGNFNISKNFNVKGNSTLNNLDVSGNATINNYYGEMWNKSDASFEMIDLVTSDTYVRVKNLTCGNINRFSCSNGNLTAQVSGVYQLNAKIGATATATAGEYGMKVFINEVGQDNCYDHEEPSLSPIGFIISCMVRLNVDDRVNIRFDDHADPVRDLTLYNANVNLVRIGK